MKSTSSAAAGLAALLSGGDVALHLLSFLHTKDLGHLLSTNHTLHRALLLPTPDACRVWEAVLAADLARYGIPAAAAVGGWATGRGLVAPPAVRWCRRGPVGQDEEEGEGSVDARGEEEEELVPDPHALGQAFCARDVVVFDDKNGVAGAFDPEGGALYAFGGMEGDVWEGGVVTNVAREWRPAAGWRTLRIRGRSPPPRQHADAACVRINRGRDRALVVWGGQFQGGLRYNDLWLLPLSKEDEEGEGLMWVALSNGGPDNPPPRFSHTFTATKDALVVYGGRDSMTQAVLRDAWIYDLNTLGSRWVKVNNNGNASGAPYGRFGHVAAATPHDGVLVMGGLTVDLEDADAPIFWWRRRTVVYRRGMTYDRCVWVLDVGEAVWGRRALRYVPCIAMTRRSTRPEPIAPPGDPHFEGIGHSRLIPVPGLPWVFLAVSLSPTAGVGVINLEGGWWRWLPRPPFEEGGQWGVIPRVAWLRHGHLMVLWQNKYDSRGGAYYIRWPLPWLVDPAPRPPPVWERVEGTHDFIVGETAVMVEDGGSGVIRVTGSRRRGEPVLFT